MIVRSPYSRHRCDTNRQLQSSAGVATAASASTERRRDYPSSLPLSRSRRCRFPGSSHRLRRARRRRRHFFRVWLPWPLSRWEDSGREGSLSIDEAGEEETERLKEQVGEKAISDGHEEKIRCRVIRPPREFSSPGPYHDHGCATAGASHGCMAWIMCYLLEMSWWLPAVEIWADATSRAGSLGQAAGAEKHGSSRLAMIWQLGPYKLRQWTVADAWLSCFACSCLGRGERYDRGHLAIRRADGVLHATRDRRPTGHRNSTTSR